ncbi:MAG: AmmeMemoRadiSam system protein A, partial [Planctomycetes bacterium]|nr:AmmeMemoRadiSam system protein A [Planctomycetota bacterium]
MTPEQQTVILNVARRAVQDEVRGEGSAGSPPDVDLPTEFGGAFVTLKLRRRLRGCMGTFRPLGNLSQTIDRVARMSAGEDPRFAKQRIGPDDLDEIEIEVSILSPPERTDRPADLTVGRHGILIRRGAASGCFLPQVATERGWSAEEFLSQCCRTKAGLKGDAWKQPDTEVLL